MGPIPWWVWLLAARAAPDGSPAILEPGAEPRSPLPLVPTEGARARYTLRHQQTLAVDGSPRLRLARRLTVRHEVDDSRTVRVTIEDVEMEALEGIEPPTEPERRLEALRGGSIRFRLADGGAIDSVDLAVDDPEVRPDLGHLAHLFSDVVSWPTDVPLGDGATFVSNAPRDLWGLDVVVAQTTRVTSRTADTLDLRRHTTADHPSVTTTGGGEVTVDLDVMGWTGAVEVAFTFPDGAEEWNVAPGASYAERLSIERVE